ncbi:siderophore-interacting protein [Streptomyces sp. NPDC048404]|uniref:siderophore-interacting protein n=1 Tax=unclassified Streptomyces TaxID=2593676 RepID=UPI003439BFD2
MTAPRIQRPHSRRMLSLNVRAGERISPHFMSITLGGDDVRHLEQCGYDQSGRLFFADPDDDDVFLPNSERWILQLTLRGSKRRPRVRTYTIRRFRPESLAFDIEISLHETDNPQRPGAPGNRWARATEPGTEVAFLDEGYSYAPAPGSAWQLLVGDESALPAILAILESPAALPAEVFLEVPAREDIRDDATVPPGTTIHWLPRGGPGAKPGVLALEAVRRAQLPDGPFYAWTAGESSLATGVRRHLVGERRIPKSELTFRGYFSHGRAGL